MNTQQSANQFWYKLKGYYLIPHELLHVLAYRLINKPCHYRWGEHRVYSKAKKTQREQLFVLLMPFVMCWLVGLFLHGIWLVLVLSTQMLPEVYFKAAPRWHFIFPSLASLFIIYSGTGYRDIRRTLRILSGQEKPCQNSTNPHRQSKNKYRSRQ